MFISLSMLPVYLLLVLDVTSADLGTVKRVPRRHTHVTRTYDYNRPPIHDDKIPVIVVYEKQEVINENVNKAARTAEDEKKYMKHETSNEKSVNLEAPNAKVDDLEEVLSLKPKPRSIKIPEAKTSETITPVESGTRAGVIPRRRIQKVRKIKVDKSQLDGFVTEIIGNKEAQKVATTPPQTGAKEPSQRVPQTFSRRKGMRDPVVPIIESESYVFSHSGDFHYSYEGGDGTKAYERGELRSFNGGTGSAVEGNFSYKDKDGHDVSLSYTADENGYRPVGAHLPTPPPIPIAIQRALAYLATKPTPEPITERIKTL